MPRVPRGSERLLLPLAVLEGQTIDEDLARFLGAVEVELVGYHTIPEQTAPSQMRHQFEPQATRILEEITTTIVDAGGSVNQRLVFTHDLEQSLSRVRTEVAASGELLVNPTGPVESALVPVLGGLDPARMARFIDTIRSGQSIAVTLLALPTAADPESAPSIARAIADALIEAGMSPDSIDVIAVQATAPVEPIIEAATRHDVTIMAERVPDWRSVIFGDVEARIARESLGPVFVVYPDPNQASTD